MTLYRVQYATPSVFKLIPYSSSLQLMILKNANFKQNFKNALEKWSFHFNKIKH